MVRRCATCSTCWASAASSRSSPCYPLLERPDLVTQRGQTGAQGHRDGRLRIFDQRADLWDDVARAHWYRHAKLAEQSAQRIEPRRPGPDPRRAHAMEGRDGLLRHRLDRHRIDLLVPGRFEQRFRIRAIGLIATDIPAGLMRGQQLDGVAELFQGARPMVRRPAGFEQHGRGRALGEEPQEPGPGQPMLFIHTPRVMRDRHLKHGLGEVNGDRCMLHLDSSSAVARRGRFTTGTMMPHQREESIPSLVQDCPDSARGVVADQLARSTLLADNLRVKSKVHPKYKTKYHGGNWPEYEQALVRRGDVTLWLSAEAMDAWRPAPSGRPGGPRKFSDVWVANC